MKKWNELIPVSTTDAIYLGCVKFDNGKVYQILNIKEIIQAAANEDIKIILSPTIETIDFEVAK